MHPLVVGLGRRHSLSRMTERGTNVSDKKGTGFDRASQAELVDESELADAEGGGSSSVPRTIFTRDSAPDPKKLQVSQLRIAQGMTAEVKERKANVGQFVLSNFPAYDSVILIPFDAQDIRQYKPDPKKPAVCHAPTGDFGFGKPGGVCELCPLQEWGEYNEATGKSKPPPCKEGITVRFYSIAHRSMVDYIFLAGEKGRGAFIRQQSLSFGWTGFAIRMTSKNKSNSQGDWFVPEVEMLETVPEDQLDIIAKWYELHLASQQDTKQSALIQLTERTP